MVRLSNYLSKKVELRSGAVQGKGIFAVAPIGGEIVAIFGGLVRHYTDTNDETSLQVSDEYFLKRMEDSQGKLDDGEYINHSCDPNCGIRGQIILEAMRDIDPGEEITFDYATTDSKVSSFLCKCGSSQCRKMIGPDDWKRKDLQQRYRGYFSYYLQNRIDQLQKER